MDYQKMFPGYDLKMQILVNALTFLLCFPCFLSKDGVNKNLFNLKQFPASKFEFSFV